MKYIRKVMNVIHIGTIAFAMLCLIAMVCIVVTNVVLRYLFNTAIQWGEEITMVLVIWFTFIALALGVKLNLHISIGVLPMNLHPWLDRMLIRFKRFVTLLVGVVLLVYGIILVAFTSHSILPSTRFPSAIMYLPIPLVSIFIIYESILVLFHLDQDDPYLENILNRDANV